jgi:hypothetical protein
MAGGSIFDRENITILPLMVIMICLIVFTVCFETLLHSVEHLFQNYPTKLKYLNKVYKELMILGFVSFSLLLTINFYPTIPSKTLL